MLLNKKQINNYNFLKPTKLLSKTDGKKIIINIILYYGLRVFILSYGIIRIFLINIYLGISNFGLLNVMMLISPLCLFCISGCQDKSNFILYKYSLINDFKSLNRLINEQIKEMRFYSFLSLFLVFFLMIISYFFVNSPGLNHITACLLILGNSVGMLSFGIILPYVQWYLNSLHFNYVYDIWEIFFATLLNVTSFILIIIFGKHEFVFPNTNYEEGATYIVLIVTFLLSIRLGLANIILNFFKKKYMSWFKREKIKHFNFFDKNTISYIAQSFLSAVAVTIVPISFFILTTVIHLGTALSGIYYSYVTFVVIINLLGWGITAIKPYLAKFIIKNSREKMFHLNKLITYAFFYIGLILLINFVIISPYLMVFMKSYFSFWLAFLIGICYLFFVVKLVDEAFIYLDGRPEKYWRLTLYEICVGIIFIVISISLVFCIPSLSHNVISLIFAIGISEASMRISKYFFNIVYLNKYIYHKNIIEYFHHYWTIYMITLITICVIVLVISLSPYIKEVENSFRNNQLINVWSFENITSLFKDDLYAINYQNVFISIIFVNIFIIFLWWSNIKFINNRTNNEYKQFIKEIKKEIIYNIKWRKYR